MEVVDGGPEAVSLGDHHMLEAVVHHLLKVRGAALHVGAPGPELQDLPVSRVLELVPLPVHFRVFNKDIHCQ